MLNGMREASIAKIQQTLQKRKKKKEEKEEKDYGSGNMRKHGNEARKTK